MKILYIIRHAKSDKTNFNIKDFDRPLENKGFKDAKKLGKYLKKENIIPDIFFSSSALRTKQTSEVIGKEINFDSKKIHFEEDLYNYHMTGIDFYISFLMGIKDKHKKVFFVGHNDNISELISYFIGKENGYVKTCSITSLVFDINSWKEISYGNGKLLDYKTPDDL